MYLHKISFRGKEVWFRAKDTTVFDEIEKMQKRHSYLSRYDVDRPLLDISIEMGRQLDRIADMLEALKIVVKYCVDIEDLIGCETYEDYVESIKNFFAKICPEDTKERKEKVIESWTMSEDDFYFTHEQLKEVDDYLLEHWAEDKPWKNQKLIDKWILEMERNIEDD